MKEITAAQAASYAGGTLFCGPAGNTAVTVERDSRLTGEKSIFVGLKGEMPPNEMREQKVSTMTLYVDRKLALSSAFATAMSMIVSCLFWAASGWPTGFAAPMMAGMYCMFFSTFDNPVPILKTQFYCTLLSSPVSGMSWCAPLTRREKSWWFLLRRLPFSHQRIILYAHCGQNTRKSPRLSKI